MLENDTEYLRAVSVGDLAKARGLENMDRLIARDPVYTAMVYLQRKPKRLFIRLWCMCDAVIFP